MPEKVSKPTGRPTVMTEEVLELLRTAFKAGSTDKEACQHAGINESTLYKYQTLYPEFIEEKELLKESPAISARLLLAQKVSTDIGAAQWYLERKKKDEFSSRSELTGKNGESLQVEIIEDTALKDAQGE